MDLLSYIIGMSAAGGGGSGNFATGTVVTREGTVDLPDPGFKPKGFAIAPERRNMAIEPDYAIVLILTGFTANDRAIAIGRGESDKPDVTTASATDAEGAAYSVNGNVITAGGDYIQMSYQDTETGNEYRYVIWG